MSFREPKTMKDVLLRSFLIVGLLIVGCVIIVICGRANIAHAKESVIPFKDPGRFVTISSQKVGGVQISVIKDSKNGWEYMINSEGGIFPIIPKDDGKWLK